jgi:hypothetical protein
MYKFILILFVLLTASPVVSTQKVDSVTVNCPIYVDEMKQFQFEKIRIYVLQHSNEGTGWEKVGVFTPNQAGLFTLSVPDQTWIKLEISTSDPTISQENSIFYSLEEGESETIYRSDLYIDKNQPETLNQRIDLKRSGAFSLCIPDKIINGGVYFQNISTKSPLSIIKFFTRESVKRPDIGGLTPGRYLISILDDKTNREVFKKQITIEIGKLLTVQCK